MVDFTHQIISQGSPLKATSAPKGPFVRQLQLPKGPISDVGRSIPVILWGEYPPLGILINYTNEHWDVIHGRVI